MQLPHKVIEAVPGERLVLEGMGPGGLPFRQEVVVRRDGGETVIELVHSGFDDAADWSDEYEGMDSGWKMALAILKHYLENHFGRSRRTYFAMRPATYENAQLDGAFRSEAGLGRWLTTGGSIGDVGAPVALQLQHGGPVDRGGARVDGDRGRRLLGRSAGRPRAQGVLDGPARQGDRPARRQLGGRTRRPRTRSRPG